MDKRLSEYKEIEIEVVDLENPIEVCANMVDLSQMLMVEKDLEEIEL